MSMTDNDTTGAPASAATAPAMSAAEARLQRNMKIVVVALGVLLFAGLAAIAGRIIYLASARDAQPAADIVQAPAPRLAVPPAAALNLPAGAVVRSVSISGDRLAVHFEGAGAEGIAIYDLASGRPLTVVDVTRTAPD